MPSQPPETEFYDDPANFELWRDLTRMYEEFCTVKELPEKQTAFATVLKDVLSKLGELEPMDQPVIT